MRLTEAEAEANALKECHAGQGNVREAGEAGHLGNFRKAGHFREAGSVGAFGKAGNVSNFSCTGTFEPLQDVEWGRLPFIHVQFFFLLLF